MKARIFLVDDEPAVLRGLRALISQDSSLEVCGACQSAPEALAQISALKPDLAVVDLSLREGDGLELTSQLRQTCPALKIVVFSMHSQARYVHAAAAKGAQGYVFKDKGMDDLIPAIHKLLLGNTYFPDPPPPASPNPAKRWCGNLE